MHWQCSNRMKIVRIVRPCWMSRPPEDEIIPQEERTIWPEVFNQWRSGPWMLISELYCIVLMYWRTEFFHVRERNTNRMRSSNLEAFFNFFFKWTVNHLVSCMDGLVLGTKLRSWYFISLELKNINATLHSVFNAKTETLRRKFFPQAIRHLNTDMLTVQIH